MIDIEYIRSFFPPTIARESRFDRYMLKEYLQLLILDHLATTPYINKVSFIGGTNLRLIQGIDRFSEDLDFDCKELSEDEFMAMTDSVVTYLRQNNIDVETRDKPNPKLTAFRRNLYFPEMLFDLGLTGHKEERLLLKVEAQNQGVPYQPVVANINRMGFFFGVQVPPIDVLCAMKFAAILARQKGRDFYDTIFLLSKTRPNLDFLSAKAGISTIDELKTAIAERLKDIDLNHKKRDFSHLVFNEQNAERILQFPDVVAAKIMQNHHCAVLFGKPAHCLPDFGIFGCVVLRRHRGERPVLFLIGRKRNQQRGPAFTPPQIAPAVDADRGEPMLKGL